MRRPLVIAGAAVGGLLLLGYGGSFLLSGDKVPRGVHVAGVDLSGMTAAHARDVLGRELADDATAPLELVAEDVRLTLAPARAGLRPDINGTVDEARSAGPLDRLRGLLGTRRDVDPKAEVRSDALTAALQALAPRVDRPAREGTITFTGTTPMAVRPVAGRSLDVAGAADAVRAAYLRRRSVDVPVTTAAVRNSAQDVQKALTSVAQPAVAAPVTVDVEGKPLEVQPADIAAGLGCSADLEPQLDGAKVLASLGRRLDAVQVAPKDATFRILSGSPVLVPSTDGRVLPAQALSSALSAVLTKPAPRRASVGLEVGHPRVTTEQAQTLGIREVIGTFTTQHPCCAPRVQNIHAIADLLDGYVVLPGETFSLNGVVGRRDKARGFVEAPQILRGQFVKDVGGGVSQFTTTLFNAVFFSGLKDVQHTPHSYYISRYPPGRESTVSFPQPDFRFQDDAPTGVLITTSYTGTSVTVTFWGTKRYDVESVTGPRTRVKSFGTEYVDREDCTASTGAEGFDIVVTRVFKMGGRVVRREPFKTRYLPEPHFICGSPPPGQPAKQPASQ